MSSVPPTDEIAMLMGYEALRIFLLRTLEVETPIETLYDTHAVRKKTCLLFLSCAQALEW